MDIVKPAERSIACLQAIKTNCLKHLAILDNKFPLNENKKATQRDQRGLDERNINIPEKGEKFAQKLNFTFSPPSPPPPALPNCNVQSFLIPNNYHLCRKYILKT